MIRQINRWYDGVREPWRFFIAMALVLPPLFALSADAQIVRSLGAGFFCAIVGIRLLGHMRPKRRTTEFVVVDVERGEDGQMKATETERFIRKD